MQINKKKIFASKQIKCRKCANQFRQKLVRTIGIVCTQILQKSTVAHLDDTFQAAEIKLFGRMYERKWQFDDKNIAHTKYKQFLNCYSLVLLVFRSGIIFPYARSVALFLCPLHSSSSLSYYPPPLLAAYLPIVVVTKKGFIISANKRKLYTWLFGSMSEIASEFSYECHDEQYDCQRISMMCRVARGGPYGSEILLLVCVCSTLFSSDGKKRQNKYK